MTVVIQCGGLQAGVHRKDDSSGNDCVYLTFKDENYDTIAIQSEYVEYAVIHAIY